MQDNNNYTFAYTLLYDGDDKNNRVTYLCFISESSSWFSEYVVPKDHLLEFTNLVDRAGKKEKVCTGVRFQLEDVCFDTKVADFSENVTGTYKEYKEFKEKIADVIAAGIAAANEHNSNILLQKQQKGGPDFSATEVTQCSSRNNGLITK